MSDLVRSRAGVPSGARGVALCLVLAVAALLVADDRARADEARTLRVVAISASALASADEARRMVAEAVVGGFNTVFVPVTLDSAHDPAAGILDAVIRDARARGLRVHASVPILLAAPAGALPSSRDHVIYRHPDWLMVPRALAVEMRGLDPRSPDYVGRLARWTRANRDRVDGLYLSAAHPEIGDYIATALKQLVSRHAVDGVHLEAVRLPAPDFDYGLLSIDAFRRYSARTLPAGERARLDAIEAIDPFGYAEELPEEWRRFRVTRLTSLVAQLRTAVRSVRPDAVVSAAVVPGAQRALDRHLQDWRTWLDNGFVDALADPGAPGVTLLSSYDALIDPVRRPDPPAGPAGASP